ncbi:unnamed protein product, partial [Protopolystoma xenopodis]
MVRPSVLQLAPHPNAATSSHLQTGQPLPQTTVSQKQLTGHQASPIVSASGGATNLPVAPGPSNPRQLAPAGSASICNNISQSIGQTISSMQGSGSISPAQHHPAFIPLRPSSGIATPGQSGQLQPSSSSSQFVSPSQSAQSGIASAVPIRPGPVQQTVQQQQQQVQQQQIYQQVQQASPHPSGPGGAQHLLGPNGNILSPLNAQHRPPGSSGGTATTATCLHYQQVAATGVSMVQHTQQMQQQNVRGVQFRQAAHSGDQQMQQHQGQQQSGPRAVQILGQQQQQQHQHSGHLSISLGPCHPLCYSVMGSLSQQVVACGLPLSGHSGPTLMVSGPPGQAQQSHSTGHPGQLVLQAQRPGLSCLVSPGDSNHPSHHHLAQHHQQQQQHGHSQLLTPTGHHLPASHTHSHSPSGAQQQHSHVQSQIQQQQQTQQRHLHPLQQPTPQQQLYQNVGQQHPHASHPSHTHLHHYHQQPHSFQQHHHESAQIMKHSTTQLHQQAAHLHPTQQHRPGLMIHQPQQASMQQAQQQPSQQSQHHPSAASHQHHQYQPQIQQQPQPPPPGSLLPAHYGHAGSPLPQTREDCLTGCVFLLLGYQRSHSEEQRQIWRLIIRTYGGEVALHYQADRVTHLVVDWQLEDPELFKQ